MELTFNGAQIQVDEWIKRHPDGYFPDKKLFEKMNEERNEIEEELAVYKETPTEENLKKLKIEIGDELFALICLANSKNISLDECFELMIEKNKHREKNNYVK